MWTFLGRFYEPIIETVVHHTDRRPIGLAANSLLGLDRTFQPLRNKCGYVEAMIEESRKAQPPIRIVKPTGSLITDQATLLQTANPRFKCNGMVPAPKIKPGYIKRCQRAHAIFSSRCSAVIRRLSRLEFKSSTVVKGIALRFLD